MLADYFCIFVTINTIRIMGQIIISEELGKYSGKSKTEFRNFSDDIDSPPNNRLGYF